MQDISYDLLSGNLVSEEFRKSGLGYLYMHEMTSASSKGSEFPYSSMIV